MTIEVVRDALLWCWVINVGMLLFWSLMFLVARDWIYRLHSRWFKLSEESFNTIHYAGILFLKTTIFVFFLVPYIALWIVH